MEMYNMPQEGEQTYNSCLLHHRKRCTMIKCYLFTLSCVHAYGLTGVYDSVYVHKVGSHM
jgi:hypothetical protein